MVGYQSNNPELELKSFVNKFNSVLLSFKEYELV